MAKPKLNATLRVAGRAYTPGQEEELAAALLPEDGERHLKSGILEGDWSFTGEPPVQEVPKPTTAPLAVGEESVEVKSLRSELEAKKTQLQESIGLNTRLTSEKSGLQTIIDNGKAENKRQADELAQLRPLKQENTTLKSKVAKVENDLKELKAKATAAPPAATPTA